jgi:hypothetical protein
MRTTNGLRPTVLASAALLACQGWAMELDTGNPDWSVRFDNTVKASTKIRTESADPALKDSFRLVVPGVSASAFPQALNFNAGDQNFQKRGFVSERVDLLSEFDAVFRKDFGARISAAAWYDHALHQNTHADNDPTIGQTPYNEFPARTRRIAGGDGEILDAFVFGGWRLDNGMKVTGRLGQHALQWGETLFYGDNGIARAQGPIDIDKLLASPNAQFKEFIRPVPQVSGQLQVTPNVAVGAYYQFRWEEDRLPPSGSYFSTANIPWGASQPEFVGIPGVGNFVLGARGDQQAKNSGQFGVQLKWRVDETDLGFYYARYHDKDGQLYGQINPLAPPSPFGTQPGNWYYVFPEDIKTFGASASHSFGDFNVAAEGSVRDNMPLRSGNMLYGFFPGQPQPRFATGRTAHLNLSTLATFGPSFIARESSLVAEIAWNRVLHTNDPDKELDQGRTRDASAMQLVFTPSYRQVSSGLDLSVPIGLRYSLSGSSSVTAWDSKGNGSATIGLEGNYLQTWQFAMTYTHYIGKAVPFVDYSPALTGGTPIFGHGNSLADRNYLAFSVRRTF